MSDIGKRIRAYRMRLQITQEELAEKMGYKSKSTINKIEAGVNDIPQSKIVQFSNVLGVSVADLMGWNEIIEEKPVETANKLADLFFRLEFKDDESDVMIMLEEYFSLPEPKKAQVREYVHLLSGKD